MALIDPKRSRLASADLLHDGDSAGDPASGALVHRMTGPVLLARVLYLTAPAAMLFALLLRPIWDVDIFWQLRLGEMILRSGAPIPHEPFAAAHLGEALPSVAWLGQAAFAKVRLLGGWTALRVFDAVVWISGFWAVAAACRRRGATPLGLLLAFAVAFPLALPAASIRPQSFAVLGFGLLLALLRLQWSAARTLIVAVPLLLLWQNLHPSVSIAAISLAATASVAWLRYLADRRVSPPWLLCMLTGLAGLAIFITPAGASIIAVSADNAKASIAIGATEWLPIWAAANQQYLAEVTVTAMLVGGLLVRQRRRVDWEELTPAVLLFLATLTSYRFVLFWSLALVPVVARVMTESEPIGRPSWSERVIAPLTLAATIALALVMRPTAFSPSLPLAAITKLRETGVTGVVFDYPPWGGPLIDAGSPNWTVAYDGRYYRYGPDEWRRYQDTTRGLVGPADLERIYHPAAYVLKPGQDTALITALRASAPTWRQIYADGGCVVFVRNHLPAVGD